MSDTSTSDRQGPFHGRRRDAAWLGRDVWAHEDAGWEIRSVGPSGREVDRARSAREAGIKAAWWARRVARWVRDLLGPQTVGTLAVPAPAPEPRRRARVGTRHPAKVASVLYHRRHEPEERRGGNIATSALVMAQWAATADDVTDEELGAAGLDREAWTAWQEECRRLVREADEREAQAARRKSRGKGEARAADDGSQPEPATPPAPPAPKKTVEELLRPVVLAVVAERPGELRRGQLAAEAAARFGDPRARKSAERAISALVEAGELVLRPEGVRYPYVYLAESAPAGADRSQTDTNDAPRVVPTGPDHHGPSVAPDVRPPAPPALPFEPIVLPEGLPETNGHRTST